MRTLNVTRKGWITVGWIISILGLAPGSTASVGVWITKAEMPTARSMPCTAVVEGKIYVIGGTLGVDSTSTVVEVYDPETGNWEQRSHMPASRGAAAACVVDGIIYVLGGAQISSSGTSTVFAYDPMTDTWTRKADMATPRQAPAACVVDGMVYVIGGLVQSTSPTSQVEVYDPSTDTWFQKASMPLAVGILSDAVVDGVIYVFGGGQAGGPGLSSVFAYDPRTDLWTEKADMPTARMGFCTALVGGIVYAVGGTPYGGGPSLSTVEAYDPATDSWIVTDDMPTPRKYPACAVVNGRLHVIGGMQSAPLATLEVYDLTPPPPDFNGDGNIDGKDVQILADHWAQVDSVCDIAPKPFGDGIVDLQDLVALADYIGMEVNDPTLIAHWSLDEAGGGVAHDSVAGNDASLVGEPIWQTDAGQVGGALLFDGLDDCAITEPVLSPADGPFSVLVWVKGGAPGQVLVSQIDGANWLGIDPVLGTLMSELKSAGRFSQPLYSGASVTNDTWHRIGFTWDGSNRRLYVDDTLVAEDTDLALAACGGGLNIGCDKDMTPGTFFSGLIDDVRIYNRAIRP